MWVGAARAPPALTPAPSGAVALDWSATPDSLLAGQRKGDGAKNDLSDAWKWWEYPSNKTEDTSFHLSGANLGQRLGEAIIKHCWENNDSLEVDNYCDGDHWEQTMTLAKMSPAFAPMTPKMRQTSPRRRWTWLTCRTRPWWRGNCIQTGAWLKSHLREEGLLCAWIKFIKSVFFTYLLFTQSLLVERLFNHSSELAELRLHVHHPRFCFFGVCGSCCVRVTAVVVRWWRHKSLGEVNICPSWWEIINNCPSCPIHLMNNACTKASSLG